MYRRTALIMILVASTITPEAFSQIEAPMTPREHAAQALVYEKRIAELQAEVVQHRRMKVDYARTVATSPKGPKNPWIVQMDKHCDDAIEQLRVLGAEYVRMAEYHRFRAAEALSPTPRTAEETDARVAEYRARASEYRKQAAEHRAMRKQFEPLANPKGSLPDSKENQEMRAHCDRIIAAADALASSSEKFAELFATHAQELRGKKPAAVGVR